MRNDGTSTEDLLAGLRAADPARRTDLDGLDPTVLRAFRSGIATADGGRPGRTRGLRWTRRTVVAGGVVALLVGGGAAYAGYRSWYAGDGGADGITCSLDYGPRGAHGDLTSGGPSLTGDPIADCVTYQDLAGLPPIPDPVAFADAWHPVVVVPRDQVPEGATVLATASPADLAARELEASLHDLVDGPDATCPSPEVLTVAAQAELDRLGLTGWRVEQGEPAEVPGECADLGADRDAGVLLVRPESRDSLETMVARGDVVPFVQTVRDALRAGIADACVALPEAEAVVAAAIGTEHHWPTATIEDPDAACTRVDLEVGGSLQVTLRGPRVLPDAG